MSATENHRDIGSLSATTITEAAAKRLALAKAYALIDGYVAEGTSGTSGDPFAREPKSVSDQATKRLP